MEKKAGSKKKIVNIVIAVVVVAGLMLTAHILVNYFNIAEVIKGIHGG
ncbi:MAG TPA: hypothetical protein VK880_05885 [Anaerolineales bacterium]|nr:hypothetical protein [Anaerolineales bacterium]